MLILSCSGKYCQTWYCSFKCLLFFFYVNVVFFSFVILSYKWKMQVPAVVELVWVLGTALLYVTICGWKTTLEDAKTHNVNVNLTLHKWIDSITNLQLAQAPDLKKNERGRRAVGVGFMGEKNIPVMKRLYHTSNNSTNSKLLTTCKDNYWRWISETSLIWAIFFKK